MIDSTVIAVIAGFFVNTLVVGIAWGRQSAILQQIAKHMDKLEVDIKTLGS